MRAEVPPNQAVWPSKSPVFEGSVLKTSGLLMALRSSTAYAPGALFCACSSWHDVPWVKA